MVDSDTPSRDDRLNQAIGDYLVRSDQGEHVDYRELLTRHPDLAGQLQEFFEDLALVKSSLVDSASVETDGVAGQSGDSSTSLPRVFGHFELHERLGTGATGTVWRAHDTKLDRIVAIKIPRNAEMSVEETERFLREARVAAQLRHAYIASVHEVGNVGDVVYIVSDYVDGVPLAQWHSEQSPSPVESAAICAKIADGLDHAHCAQVIHRDLKPSNIMVTLDGGPRIVDFGLAKRRADEMTISENGNIVGTPAYMSPEQAAGATDTVDDRTDIYALGVILFELLTDQRPFVGNIGRNVQQVLHVDVASARSLRGDLSPDIDNICAKCLQTSPADRYDTAGELRDDLERFVRGEPVKARPISRPRRVWRSCQRHRVVATLGLLLAIAAAAGLAGVSWHNMRMERAREFQNKALINSLLMADHDAVPNVIQRIRAHDTDLRPKLRTLLIDRDLPPRERLRIHLTLLPDAPEHLEYVRSVLPTVDVAESLLIRDALVPYRSELSDDLWEVVLNNESPSGWNLRAAAILAAFDSDNPQWHSKKWLIASQIAQQNSTEVSGWIEAFRPISRFLVEPFLQHYNDSHIAETAAMAVAEYASDQPQLLVDLLMDARPVQLRPICDALLRHADIVEAPLVDIAGQAFPTVATEGSQTTLAKRQVNAAIVLFRIGRAEFACDYLRFSPDPQRRSLLIHRIAVAGCPHESITETLRQETDATVRAGLMQCLGEYGIEALPPSDRSELILDVLDIYQKEDDPGVHAAAGWLLRSWGCVKQLDAMNQESSNGPDRPRWYVNNHGHTMALVEGPVTFTMGTPADERSHDPDEQQHTSSIGQSFWMSSQEVTKYQFMEFDSAVGRDVDVLQLRHQPMLGVSWYEAAAYCNWLSEQEDIAQDQWCYVPNDEGEYADGMTIAPDYSHRNGYRLPTEAEWEYACRAGTTTPCFYGGGRSLMRNYACYGRGQPRTTPEIIGLKKPNGFGLSDMLGNVSEWCQDRYEPYSSADVAPGNRIIFDDTSARTVRDGMPRVYRGGSYRDKMSAIRSGNREHGQPDVQDPSIGFRIVRAE